MESELDKALRIAMSMLPTAQAQALADAVQAERLMLAEVSAQCAANARMVEAAEAQRDALIDEVTEQAMERYESDRQRDALAEALRDVADFEPNPLTPNGEWCWCGYDTPPKSHHSYCLAARAALAEVPRG